MSPKRFISSEQHSSTRQGVGGYRDGTPVLIVAAPIINYFVQYDASQSSHLEHEPQMEKFTRLRNKWLEERPRGVELTQAFQHQAYRDILHMGESAIPFLLEEITKGDARMWFWALHVTSVGQDPVPPEKKGNKQVMIDSWLEWGRQMGYIP